MKRNRTQDSKITAGDDSTLKQYTEAYTHSGKFHADDVFSTALIRLWNPDITVHRVHEVPADLNPETALVYDIGGGEFDHHQQGAPIREDGRRYAAFGLLWRAFASELGLSEASCRSLDKSFVADLDEADNGGRQETLSAAIVAFNPPWNSEISIEDAFWQAVELAQSILTRLIAREKAKQDAQEEVRAALSGMQDRIVILERFAPWEDVLIDSDAAFVIYPSARRAGNFNIQGVPPERGSMAVKIPMPLAWRTCAESELAEVSGIAGLTFCHKSGFLAVGEGKETALTIARAALRLAETGAE